MTSNRISIRLLLLLLLLCVCTPSSELRKIQSIDVILSDVLKTREEEKKIKDQRYERRWSYNIVSESSCAFTCCI